MRKRLFHANLAHAGLVHRRAEFDLAVKPLVRHGLTLVTRVAIHGVQCEAGRRSGTLLRRLEHDSHDLLKARAFKDQQPARFEHAHPVGENVLDLPPPEVLNDVIAVYLVGILIGKRQRLADVGLYIRFDVKPPCA